VGKSFQDRIIGSALKTLKTFLEKRKGDETMRMIKKDKRIVERSRHAREDRQRREEDEAAIIDEAEVVCGAINRPTLTSTVNNTRQMRPNQ
jgi:hypothetical protein